MSDFERNDENTTTTFTNTDAPANDDTNNWNPNDTTAASSASRKDSWTRRASANIKGSMKGSFGAMQETYGTILHQKKWQEAGQRRMDDEDRRRDDRDGVPYQKRDERRTSLEGFKPA